jgi:hypothetical protein
MLELADRDGVDRMTAFQAQHRGGLTRLAGLPSFVWGCMIEDTFMALLDGEIDEGERLAEAALNVGLETGQPDAFLIYGIQLVNVRTAQGRFGELVPMLEDMVRDHPDRSSYRALLAESCAEAGDLDRCRSLLAVDREAGFVTTEDYGWLNNHMRWAKAAVAVRDLETAASMRSRMTPYRDRVVFIGLTVRPVAGHYIARVEHLLGDLDDADASFARAYQLHQRLRAPQFVARTEVRWAQMLVDRNRHGDHGRARELAESARAASVHRSGWDWIGRDACAVLDRLA